ncbi:uncharacterized protein BCR38DRAFT_407745 [Pseudomassariella vexata]|uniref:Zn(2)-C6 fungal-type domain-containing protein n=1 Tax=Pseudomassariella vexata TaxID=1141098 RepID=A0A1Y2E8D6_9PEZI|nr:uncharacterized protein BCR38DRAFT_407745 [Pseudomassariella vexata]ORY67809.1 hypothetical protein BCR38DRAFT_407745 [Pseudomassariella vexata]
MAKEGKLRAACDRCHDLKNRCVRTGREDSRCDRCERLDIDCVYRNTSRIGRPKTQRRTSVVSQDDSRSANMNNMPIPGSSPLCTSASITDMNQMETNTSGGTILNESPSDAMSLLVSPEAVQQLDVDWSHLDFSQCQHIDAVHEPLYRAESRALPESEPPPLPTSPAGKGRNTVQTTGRLLQLQGYLHRLVLAADTDQQPAVDYVEEVLEATKTLMEILQSNVPVNSSSSVPSTTDETSSDTRSPNIPATARHKLHNYMLVQQALTCYSYVLCMLDRVVGVLSPTGGVNNPHAAGGSVPASISLGLFSLASQPDLNARIALHLVLRMVQHLSMLIQQLASACRDFSELGDPPPSPPPSSSASVSAAETGIGGQSPGKPCRTSTSIYKTSHAVADFISEKERLLIERLSCLTSGP